MADKPEAIVVAELKLLEHTSDRDAGPAGQVKEFGGLDRDDYECSVELTARAEGAIGVPGY